jgi:CheY-like chemotaxis protein
MVTAATSSWVRSPRVLIVMPNHWPRALLRAALREDGYDALGARDLDEALTYLVDEWKREPVRLIILDQAAVQGLDDLRLVELLRKYPEADTVLLHGAFQPPLPGPWRHVVRHPASIADLAETVRQLLPLSSTAAHPIE